MTKPDFLVIGGTRCGTSWIYELLKSHPAIFMNPNIKEIQFFNRYYDKGWSWYKNFFPNKSDKYSQIGEVSADYLFDHNTPQRVHRHIPNAKFIVSLRNPVDKVYSSYRNERLYGNTSLSFEDYLKTEPLTVKKAFYSNQLRNWFKFFPKDRFLILIFEDTIENPALCAKKISEFLGVDPAGFDASLFSESRNVSFLPFFHRIFVLGSRINDLLLSRGHYRASSLLIKIGGLFKVMPKKQLRKMSKETRKELYSRLKKDIDETESLIGRRIEKWREG